MFANMPNACVPHLPQVPVVFTLKRDMGNPRLMPIPSSLSIG